MVILQLKQEQQRYFIKQKYNYNSIQQSITDLLQEMHKS
jgi:hypothetical protein